MAYNERYAEQVKKILLKKNVDFEEKKMFGGIAFMIDGKMTCGITKDDLMVRIIESEYEKALKDKNVRKMDFTGKPLKGFLYVDKSVFKDDKTLEKWINFGIEYVKSLKEKRRNNFIHKFFR